MILLKRKTFSDGFPIDKQKHMRSYEEFIESIRISFNFRINKESKKPEYRDLTGPEKLKLFQNVNIPFLLPQRSQNKDIQVISLSESIFHRYSPQFKFSRYIIS